MYTRPSGKILLHAQLHEMGNKNVLTNKEVSFMLLVKKCDHFIFLELTSNQRELI